MAGRSDSELAIRSEEGPSFFAWLRGTFPVTREHEVRSFIEQLGVLLPDDFSDDTELVASGLLSSLALFEVAVWIEEQCDGAVVAESVDIANEWNTVSSIVRFVERAQHDAAQGPSD